MKEYKYRKSMQAEKALPTSMMDTLTNQLEEPTWLHGKASRYISYVSASLVQLIKYANELVTTRRAIENNDASHSQVLELGAFSHPSHAMHEEFLPLKNSSKLSMPSTP
eukprot:1151817-Pelagomonas_calceolata.AAC.3